jgi:hypothetical protein
MYQVHLIYSNPIPRQTKEISQLEWRRLDWSKPSMSIYVEVGWKEVESGENKDTVTWNVGLVAWNVGLVAWNAGPRTKFVARGDGPDVGRAFLSSAGIHRPCSSRNDHTCNGF